MDNGWKDHSIGWVDAQLLGGEGAELGASILTPRRALHAH